MVNFIKETGIAVLLLSVIFTLSSLFWTSDLVNNRVELSNVDLGWPVSFVSQSFYQLEPPEWWFPHTMKIGAPQEYPLNFYLSQFIISALVNFLIISSILFVFLKINPRFLFLRKIISVKYILNAVGIFLLILMLLFIFVHATRQRINEGIPPPQINISLPLPHP